MRQRIYLINLYRYDKEEKFKVELKKIDTYSSMIFLRTAYQIIHIHRFGFTPKLANHDRELFAIKIYYKVNFYNNGLLNLLLIHN